MTKRRITIGDWRLKVESWILDAGCRMPDAGCWKLKTKKGD
jgi:hypothetical protein